MHFEFAYFYFGLSFGIKTIHTNPRSGEFFFFFLRSHAPVVPSKAIANSRPKWPKNHTLRGGAYLYGPPRVRTAIPSRRKLETLQPIKTFVVIFIYCTRETGLGLRSLRDSGKNSRFC